MKLNNIKTNDISQFSNLKEVCLALVGKYLKLKERTYHISLKGDMCFIHAWGDCEIEIPSHQPFTYKDDLGEHFVDKDINKITIQGKSQIFFSINN